MIVNFCLNSYLEEACPCCKIHVNQEAEGNHHDANSLFVLVKNEKTDTGIEWSVVLVYVSLCVWQKLLEKSRLLVGHE